MIYLSGELRRRLGKDTRRAQTFVAGYALWMAPIRNRLLEKNNWIGNPDDPRDAAVYRILDAWPAEMWLADDLLGWAHEAWMGAEKDHVNREEKKIGGKDLHAVTQLMSEDYMIKHLLQNTLGGWWMHRHPESMIGNKFEYMIRNADGTPVEQVCCTGWPDRVREIKIMDPCVGAGGFLLEVLEMLIPMWEFEEGLTGPNAVDLILIRNLYGMDIDQRILRVCENQLTMLAWKRSGFRTLPILNLGWTGDRRLHPDADHLGSLLTADHLDIDPNRPQERERERES